MFSEIDDQVPLGTLAGEHPVLIPVLDRFGLDYCCHGGRSLKEACEAARVSLHDVLAAIQEDRSVPRGASDQRWMDATMTELADHIEATHHARAREWFDRLTTIVPRVKAAHLARHPWLEGLEVTIRNLQEAMHDHMVREERVLFPWLRRLDRPSEIHTGPPWSVKRPISCMVHDHDEVAGLLARIRTLTDGYHAPPDACSSFRVMVDLLRELDADTRLHIHKENNILFPAGVRAEQTRGASVPKAPAHGA